MIARVIRWFNDFRTGYVRIRICEKCYRITSQNHWSKDDSVGLDLTKLLRTDNHHRYYREVHHYGHIWLCYRCFYGR